MCILCSDFVTQVHWTDQKKESTSSEVIIGEGQRERQRDRLKRAQLCNEILGLYKLKLRDWNGSKFVLEDAKGNSRIVHDLGALWHDVQELIGKAINPLDEYLITMMKNKKG